MRALAILPILSAHLWWPLAAGESPPAVAFLLQSKDHLRGKRINEITVKWSLGKGVNYKYDGEGRVVKVQVCGRDMDRQMPGRVVGITHDIHEAREKRPGKKA